MPGIKEIAEKVGVSKATVSIYLSDNETRRVGQSTKERIQQVVQELNYRPHAVAKALSSSKTRIIAILIPYNDPVFRSNYINELLSGIQSVLYANGYGMLFIPTAGKNSRDMVKNHLEQSFGYDGYILFGTRFCTLDDMTQNANLLLESGYPFSVVNMPEMNLDINQIIHLDPPETDGIEYLLGLGHRDIILMAGSKASPHSQLFIDGYRRAYSRRGLEIREANIIYGDFVMDLARSLMMKRIAAGVDFTAVYCLSDKMVAGVYEALKAEGLNIPGDVSVVGRNDPFNAALMDPPLTTVRCPVFEAGCQAAETALRTIDGDSDNRKIFLRSVLIQRTSTRPV